MARRGSGNETVRDMPGRDGERVRIEEAAHRCLAASGGESASVGEILAEAGLSTRAFYRHFGSKDDLLLAMFRRDAERFTAEMRDITRAASSPTDALRRFVRATLRLTWDPRRRRHVLLMVCEQAVRAKGYGAERARVDAVADGLLAGILEQGRSRGEFPWVRDASADAGCIGSLLRQAFDEQLADPSPDGAREAGDRVVDFALRALGGRGGRPGAAP